MARRSAQNPRYRKDAQVGSTRRSASSAKPKREAGESGGSGGKGSSKGSSAGKGSSSMPHEPDSPEFKRWRKIWLWLLIATVVFVGLTMGLRQLAGQLAQTASYVALVAAYATLLPGLWIDWSKLRPMRKEWREQIAGTGKPKSKPSEKPKDKKGDA